MSEARRRIVTTRRADDDIDRAVGYTLREGGPRVASDLIDALEEAMVLVSRYPFAGDSRFAVELGIPELRSLPLRRFHYVVVYVNGADIVRVLRVLHTSRDIPAALSQR